MGLGSDLRHAVRGLLRAPTLTLAALLCLGLGIGATTAIYSAVHTALLRPLPFREPEQLVTVFRTTPHFQTGPFSPANYLDLRARTRSLQTLAAVGTSFVLLERSNESVRVAANRAAGNLFEMLGVRALHGRLLQLSDEDPSQPWVAVIGEELWRERFGADPNLIGSQVRLDGREHEVIGILARGFRLPHGNQVLVSDIWVPLRLDPDQATQRRSNFLLVMGRLANTGIAAANAELRSVMDGIIEANPVLRGEQLRVVPLSREATRSVRGPLLLLLGAVGFVLLIASANVASLLLARGVSRRTEFALRAVLGARRWTVLRPALIETALLTCAGAALGVALAWGGVRITRSLVPGGLPQLATLAMDPIVLAFSLGLAVLVALICGVAPAWQAGRADPHDALRASSRTGAGKAHHKFLGALVAAEVALSLVLLLGAGLVLRGFQRLVSLDPGFDPNSLLTMQVNVAPDRYPDNSSVERFLLPALDALRAMPGVTDAAAISLIPYTNWGWNFNIRYEGRDVSDPTRRPLVETRTATPGIFNTLGMKLVRGRWFTAEDGPSSPLVVVANRALAERDFPGQDPVGKRFITGDTTLVTIIGIVENIKNQSPESAPTAEVYWHYAQTWRGATSLPLMVRVTGDPARFTRTVTNAIKSVDALAAVSQVQPMRTVMAQSVGRARFYLVLLAAFAVVALALASAGLYGVMSYLVVQRTREIGIRAALGSAPRNTVALIMRQGFGLVLIGTCAGLLGGFALTRLLANLLYGISPFDARTWALGTITLSAVAALALLLPARRAAATPPMVAMRTD